MTSSNVAFHLASESGTSKMGLQAGSAMDQDFQGHQYLSISMRFQDHLCFNCYYYTDQFYYTRLFLGPITITISKRFILFTYHVNRFEHVIQLLVFFLRYG